MHTGDLGYFDENGEVHIVDRLKEIITTQNRKISPSTIVDIILKHPAVVDAAVVAVPHDIDGERPLAFVIKKPGYDVSYKKLFVIINIKSIFIIISMFQNTFFL